MNKKNLLIILLLITSVIFLVLYIDSSNAYKVTVESNLERQLNLEANEFSLKIALAYCNESDIQTTLIYDCTDIEQPEIFKNTEKTIKNISSTRYVSDVSSPWASYFIDYKTGNGDYVRQTIMLTKSGDNVQWMCEVLNYEQIVGLYDKAS